MRSHTFSVQFSVATDPDFVDVSAAGTGLAGIAAGTPVHATVQEDIYPSGTGCAIMTVRIPDQDVVRFRINSPTPNAPISVTVTELI